MTAFQLHPRSLKSGNRAKLSNGKGVDGVVDVRAWTGLKQYQKKGNCDGTTKLNYRNIHVDKRKTRVYTMERKIARIRKMTKILFY